MSFLLQEMMSKHAKYGPLEDLTDLPDCLIKAVMMFVVTDFRTWALFLRICKRIKRQLTTHFTLPEATVGNIATFNHLLNSTLTVRRMTVPAGTRLEALEQFLSGNRKAPHGLEVTDCSQAILDAQPWQTLALKGNPLDERRWGTLPESLTSLRLDLPFTNAEFAQLRLPKLKWLDLAPQRREHWPSLPTVCPELEGLKLRVYGLFDAAMYANLNLRWLEVMNYGGPDTFNLDLAPFASLHTLSLGSMVLPVNLLGSVLFLQVLELVQCSVSSADLEPARRMPHLWKVTIVRASITDGDLLLPHVTCLKLQNCFGVTCTAPNMCPNVRHLELSACSVGPEGAGNIATFPHLTSLKLTSFGHIIDPTLFRRSKKLQSLMFVVPGGIKHSLVHKMIGQSLSSLTVMCTATSEANTVDIRHICSFRNLHELCLIGISLSPFQQDLLSAAKISLVK